MPTIREQVSAATGPQEALLVIADALDLIIDHIGTQSQAASAWGEWAASAPPPKPALTATHDGDQTEVVFHDPPADLKEKRGVFATEKIPLAEAFPELGEEAVVAYINGGPMWLYLYNRDFVLSMPAQLRREMVEDVASYDAQAGHELGLDICKMETESGIPDYVPGA